MQESGRRLLGDRYELDELIATGGMGQVWRGRDTLLGRRVAVKLLRSEYTADPTFLARFRAEATHAAALSHPNIAAVYDYGEAVDGDGEHLAYLVMELVEGEPLSTRLEAGPLSVEATLEVLRQTAVALAEAHHAGLVHRDVKPGNILVSDDEQVKITDFGIAWSAGSAPLTDAGQVLGTPRYLSPEIAVGEQPSPASDVYSLGLVGYECLTGQPAFDGDNAVSIALKQVNEEPEPLPAQLPAGLQELVDVAVAKDPGERLPDGDAFVAAIDLVRTGRPLDQVLPTTAPAPAVAAPPPAPPERDATRAVPLVTVPSGRAAPETERRGRRRTAVLLAVAALLLGVLAVVLVGLPGDDGAPVADAGQEQSIVLDDEDYLGRPVEDVAVELAALGLTVQRQAQPADGVAPGSVLGLDPLQDDLQPGDAVTVFFAAGTAGAPDDTGTGTPESAVVAGGGAAPGAGSVGSSAAGDGGTTGAAAGGSTGGTTGGGTSPADPAGTPGGDPAATDPTTPSDATPTDPTTSTDPTPTDPTDSTPPSDPTPTDPTDSTPPSDPTPTEPTTPSDPAPTEPTTPTDPSPTEPTTGPTEPGDGSSPPPATDPTGTAAG